MSNAEYISPADIEREFGINVKTLATWRTRRRCGDISYPRYHRFGKRMVRYLREELREDLASLARCQQ
jgi:hypothetical protein